MMQNYQSYVSQRSWLPLLLPLLLVLLVATAVACGGGEAPAPEGEMESAASDPAPAATPRVFFVAPQDGQMISVDNPVVFEFGMENYELSPVPEEVEQPRAGMGHHHLGVDTECLPAGEVIPQSDPWVHFGDASTTIEMMLEPGEHTFALQLGDDEHRTQDGLCETITIRIEEGI